MTDQVIKVPQFGSGGFNQKLKDMLDGNYAPYVVDCGLIAVVGGTITRPADTNAYAIGDIVAQSTTAGSCSGLAIAASRVANATAILRRCRLKVNDAAWLNAELYVHIFKDTPTFTNADNGAFAAGLSESNYIGAFDIIMDRSFSDPIVKGVGIPRSGSEMSIDPSSGTTNVFAVLETRTVVTPGSAKVFSLAFEIWQN